MDHQIIKRVILDQHQTIKRAVIYPRDIFLESNVNYVLTGIRRAGKSTLLYGRVKDLITSGVKYEQIIYINFDDERLINFKVQDFDDIVEVAEELSTDKHYFYFDEIQNIEGWEKFVVRLVNQKQKVDVTGSNSTMLSSEIAAKLGGRLIVKQIFPFSFKEYILFKGGNINAISAKDVSYINKLLDSYFNYGGFPEQFDLIDKRDYISSLYQKTLFGDIIAHYGLRNENSVKLLISKIAESVRNEVSYSRLFNSLIGVGYKISKDTVIDYCQYLKNAFLIFSLQNYYYSFVDKESTPKYYFMDNGILNLFLLDKKSTLLENVVAIHLYRKYQTSLYYLKGKNYDIDFYIKDKQLAIQVAYSLNTDSFLRETQSIANFAKLCKEKMEYIIVTYEQEEEISIGDIEIKVIPLIKFLLQL